MTIRALERARKKTYLINLLWLEVGSQLLSYDVAMVCGQLLSHHVAVVMLLWSEVVV